MTNKLLTIQEVSEITGFKRGMIWRAIRDGRLVLTKSTRPILISDSALQEFLSSRQPAISKSDLEKLYTQEKKSITEIFKITNVARMVIHRLLKRFGIARRTKSESMKGRSPWSADPEKVALHKKHIGDSHRGLKYNFSDEFKAKAGARFAAFNKLPHTEEWKKKQSYTHSKDRNYRWMGGGENYRGESFQQQRRKARERDNFTCQRCGATEKELGRALDVHHIKKNRHFNNNHIESNDLKNLISYCKSCHGKVERELEKKLKHETR